jgi:peroxiredoxin
VACLPVAGSAHRSHAPATGLAAVSFGSPPPDFTFGDGNAARDLASLTGKPVVINFWATWCEPCDDELAAFARLRQIYGDGVVLLAISDENGEIAGDFLHAHGVDAQVISDPERKIFRRYGVTPIPVTLVLDRSGAVTHVSNGELDWPELESAVEQAGAPATPAPTST